MHAPNESPDDALLQLKARLKATWESGDYARFAQPMLPGALVFLDHMGIPAGSKVLDVGCGAGQTALPLAERGMRVVGVDIARNLIATARDEAAQRGLDVQFDEGDAEALPYADGEFDWVFSLIGAMFAPRPQRVADELLRVCRPGGTVVMGNWTPEGFVGQLFKRIGAHVPPSPLMPSPLQWGVEEIVRERFKAAPDLRCERLSYPFDYAMPPEEVLDFFRANYGPTARAFAALDEAGQEALRVDLVDLWKSLNQADGRRTRYPGEYLYMRVRKPAGVS